MTSNKPLRFKSIIQCLNLLVFLQIQRNRLLFHSPHFDKLINTIKDVLVAAQSFMRTKKVFTNFTHACFYLHFSLSLNFVCVQDECSFVSLRDVERAMIVFEWFYENNDFFEHLLKDEPGYEV